MLSWMVAMCDAYAIKVCAIYGDETIVIVGFKCIWWVVLVANSPPTHILVLNSMNWEGGWHTAGTTLSPAHSLWWCDCFIALWAVVVGVGLASYPGPEKVTGYEARVGHVKISNSHPHSCAATASPGHVAVDLTCIPASAPLNPVVSRWTALFYVFARWCRVLEGAIWKVLLDCGFGNMIRYLLEGFILFQYVLQKLLL